MRTDLVTAASGKAPVNKCNARAEGCVGHLPTPFDHEYKIVVDLRGNKRRVCDHCDAMMIMSGTVHHTRNSRVRMLKAQ